MQPVLAITIIALQVSQAAQPAVRLRLQDPVLVAEEVFKGTVTSVEDGDSVVVSTPTERVTLQIEGVDAPELSQPGGPEARAALAALTLGKAVTVRLKNASERIARIEVAGSDTSLALIRRGMAWHCPRHAEDRDLTAAEADARRAGRGLWAAARPTPPWVYRRAAECWQEGAGAHGRGRPNFSGVWVAVSPPDRAGQTVVIRQDADTVTLEHAWRGDVRSSTYRLAGTTSRALRSQDGPVDVVAKTRWEGGALVIDERTWAVQGEESTHSRQVLWLDERGLLNLELSTPRPIGQTDVTRLVLRRGAPPPRRNDRPAPR